MQESKSYFETVNGASAVVKRSNGTIRNSELEITSAGTQTGSLCAEEHPLIVVNAALERAKQRSRRMSEELAREKQRQAEHNHWLEHGSDDLRDAWVSLCPRGTSHDVSSWKLEDIAEVIRIGGNITVTYYQREETTNLREVHQTIAKLYQEGAESAKNLDRLTLSKLLKEMTVDVGPDTVDYVVTQPKGNEKKFFFAKVIVGGSERECRDGFPYRPPEVLGKKQASEAKKRLPCFTPAGVFHPERNSDYLVQATGLYPLDIDTVKNMSEARQRIQLDPNAALVFVSITGSGLCVCVRGPVCRTAAEYSANYEAIAVAKSNEWGVEAKMDDATKDISRLRFLSFDPALYVDWDAEVFQPVVAVSEPTHRPPLTKTGETQTVDNERSTSSTAREHRDGEPAEAKPANDSRKTKESAPIAGWG